MIAAASISPVLVFLALLGACVWVGGLVAIAVVARAARATLEPPARIAFFRALGRSYATVGGAALVIALGSGMALLSDHRWSAMALAAVLVSAALLLVTAAGVRQARGMTRLRQQAVHEATNPILTERVRRGARRARMLRGAIALLSVALLLITVTLIT